MVSAPQWKKRRTMRSTRNSPPRKLTPPPRCTKTKRGVLTDTISYESVAELSGAGSETVESPSTGVQDDSDTSMGDEGVIPATDEDRQTGPTLPDDGEWHLPTAPCCL